MSRLVKVLLFIVAVVFFGFIGMAVGFSYLPTSTEINQQFITANPVDLEQIAAFSQYRSCAGHDYRPPTVTTGELEKTPRSMKHYIKAKPEYRGTQDRVSVFAPFDGEIFLIDNDLGGPGDQQIWLTPDTHHPASPRHWQFVFFHINLNPSLREGMRVTAGQKIGTANLARGPEYASDNFDFAVKFTRPMHQPAVDEVFSHMTPDVVTEYKRYGITPDKLIIAEAYRDLHDCPLLPRKQNVPGQDPDTIYFPPEAGAGEYIFLNLH
ncbi:MAG TPA: hypothetical protein VJH70_00285 [Candidatus Paceibacterota bacterium]